ncbi:3-alpha-(or 20-beta)-hydroxysteroid dehydrogenase [Ophiostoma piceae UAMH 11346]|uniref:3-alpha-(Or 20-beta)-hydroxysteroid dehydrogenase n=1 Tax=Ophiostoma piceae (strain UAMH 11346) TaxID=1262450 RepID=S3CEZ0_OPHP1|nr:3-alpha-(or 20-beta)-hydroxysteroid dehydrogenase [Ophiostoma piceae UAMH 11346]
MSSLKGSVIAITGAASGMGLCTAKILAKHGAHLSLADVQAGQLKEASVAVQAIAQEAGHTIKVFTAVVDIRDRVAVDKWTKDTVAELGPLNGAANIAGVFKSNLKDCVADEEDDLWDLMISVNLTGTMNCMRAQVASMREHGVADKKAGASIVNAASIMAVQGAPGSAAYCSSKHGVVGLTRATAKEVGKLGIRVNAFAPGFIDTPMLRRSMEARGGQINTSSTPTSIALGREGQPEEVAELVVFLLGSQSSYISGQCISVDGGWNC